jgi:phage gpG-like protein
MHVALQMVANQSVSNYFEQGGMDDAINAKSGKNLTMRTGRLVQSIVGGMRFSTMRLPTQLEKYVSSATGMNVPIQGKGRGEEGGAGGGKRESIRKVTGSGGKLTGWVGTKVPYAGLHERGGTVTVPVTPLARRFFWYMDQQAGGGSKWFGMAVSKKDSFTMNIPARPFLEPAAKDMHRDIRRMFIDMVTGKWDDEMRSNMN